MNVLGMESIKSSVLSALTLLYFFFVLPSDNAALMGIGAGALFSMVVGFHPEHFRSRRGSLKPALLLVAFVWICAAVPGILAVVGDRP